MRGGEKKQKGHEAGGAAQITGETALPTGWCVFSQCSLVLAHLHWVSWVLVMTILAG